MAKHDLRDVTTTVRTLTEDSSGADGWEAKVLERIRSRVEELSDLDHHPADMGWEAGSLEVLRHHVEARGV